MEGTAVKEEDSKPKKAAVVVMRERLPEFEALDIRIAPNANPDDVMHALHVCCDRLRDELQHAERVRFVIGRILLGIKQLKLWKPKYESFESFLQKEVLVRYRFSRSLLWREIKIARVLPELKPTEYERYGSLKTDLASKAVVKGVITQDKAMKLLPTSTRLSVEEFRGRLKLDGGSNGGGRRRHGERLVLVVPHRLAVSWRKFLKAHDGDVVEGFGQLLESAERQVTRKPAVMEQVSQSQSQAKAS